MSERSDRLPRLARGLLLRRRPGVAGGERLMAFGPGIKVSRPHRGAQLFFGERVMVGEHVKFYLDSPEARIEVGAYSGINRRAEICAKTMVRIGEGCAIGWDVCITDSDYHEFENSDRVSPITIGDNVWIGARAMVLKGVTIGDGAVIAAGAVITRDVPERTLVAGPRAEVVRHDVSWVL